MSAPRPSLSCAASNTGYAALGHAASHTPPLPPTPAPRRHVGRPEFQSRLHVRSVSECTGRSTRLRRLSDKIGFGRSLTLVSIVVSSRTDRRFRWNGIQRLCVVRGRLNLNSAAGSSAHTSRGVLVAVAQAKATINSNAARFERSELASRCIRTDAVSRRSTPTDYAVLHRPARTH
jgi:hypothetical protein